MKRPLSEHPITLLLSLLAAIALWLVIRQRAVPQYGPPAPMLKTH
jgi:hypothetical protein